MGSGRAQPWSRRKSLREDPGGAGPAQAHGGVLWARERVQGAAAGARGRERRFRALAGGSRAVRARHGASASPMNACSHVLSIGTTGFVGQFDPEDVLLPPPPTPTSIDAELKGLHVGTLKCGMKVIFEGVI